MMTQTAPAIRAKPYMSSLLEHCRVTGLHLRRRHRGGGTDAPSESGSGAGLAAEVPRALAGGVSGCEFGFEGCATPAAGWVSGVRGVAGGAIAGRPADEPSPPPGLVEAASLAKVPPLKLILSCNNSFNSLSCGAAKNKVSRSPRREVTAIAMDNRRDNSSPAI